MPSDKIAKKALISHLESAGYSTFSPHPVVADVGAKKNGETFFFELKSSTLADGERYFGSVSGREWIASFSNENYCFVLGWRRAGEWVWKFISPQQLLLYCRLQPSFNSYIYLRLDEKKEAEAQGGELLTEKKMRRLDLLFRKSN